MTSFNEGVTTFLLIRHGSTELVGKALAGRMPNVSLDATGRNQAHQLIARLADKKIAAIYSSPLERTVETAEPLASHLGYTVTLRDRLTEIDFGEWQGKTLPELEGSTHWADYNTHRSYIDAPGGELMLHVQARMAKELDDLRRIHANETVAIVSHADVIKAAIMLYLAIPLDFHPRLEIRPASVSIVELAEWGPRVVTVNA